MKRRWFLMTYFTRI